MADTIPESTASRIMDRADACSAFDAALAWDNVAPIVDAPQGDKNWVVPLEKNFGYNCNTTKRPTSPTAFGDGESATDARVAVAVNATTDWVSIVDVR